MLMLALVATSLAQTLPPGPWINDAYNYHYDERTHVLRAEIPVTNGGRSWYLQTDSTVVLPHTQVEKQIAGCKFLVINNNGRFAQEFQLSSIPVKSRPGKTTQADLQRVLDYDVAQEQQVRAVIDDKQTAISAVNAKVKNMQTDSTIDAEKRGFVDAVYEQQLEAAKSALANKLTSINNNAALDNDQKQLLAKQATDLLQPPVDKINKIITDFKKSSTLTEDQKKIVSTEYHRQIDLDQKVHDLLQDAQKKLLSKIADDHKAVDSYDEDYHPTIKYDGNDWYNRQQTRWDAMNSGRFGTYSSWSYGITGIWFFGPIFGDIWTTKGSFSTDGKTTNDSDSILDQGETCYPQFDPRMDTPQQQKELAKLLAEAKFDSENAWRANSGYIDINPLFWHHLHSQIDLLQQRSDNEN